MYQTYISWYYWWCTRPILLDISDDIPDLYFLILLVMYQTYISWYFRWYTRPIFLIFTDDIPDLYFLILLMIYQTYISWYYWLECRASGSRDSTMESGEKTKKKETNNSRYSIFKDLSRCALIYLDLFRLI